MTELDSVLTLDQAIVTGELVVGDAVLVGSDKYRVVQAFDTKTFDLDRNTFSAVDDPANVRKFLESGDDPAGTWETWAGDYNDGKDEGHFYMECSNRGMCDRKSGQCDCFEGYEGSGCQRVSCTQGGVECSGRGACLSVTEHTNYGTALKGFTVEGIAGGYTLTPSHNPTTHTYSSIDNVEGLSARVALVSTDSKTWTMEGIQRGDTLRLGGWNGEEVVASTVTKTSITVKSALGRQHPFGTVVYLVPRYDLWDADMNRACKCDPFFTGPTCEQRICPVGQDPLCHDNTKGFLKLDDKSQGDYQALDLSYTIRGTTPIPQKNEKQSVYLETARGSLSGTFTLTFTDAFLQQWTTQAIHVNQRLLSKAYVDAATKTVVTFHPALPYGDLEAGDFLMIGDERQEIASVYPESLMDTTSRALPIHRGGVIDSVRVRNVYAAQSSNVWAFRAGPAKGIKTALLGLPNGVVPGAEVDDFNTGTLVGFHRGGASSAAGVTDIFGVASSSEALTETASSGDAATGGLAPYDMIRVVGAGGYSEFVQLRNVDTWVSGSIEALRAKGTLTTQASTDIDLGLGANKKGAIFRAGGYHVRVHFTENPGDLPEMQVDESNLLSVFFREFTATVDAAMPSRVTCKLHGGGDVPMPTSHEFKGDQGDLFLAAGMKVRVGDQVRMVTTDMKASVAGSGLVTFWVDEPFVRSGASEVVDDVDYLFYQHMVEQLYDEAAYGSLTLSRALYVPTNTDLTASGSVAAGTGKYTLSAAAASGATTSWQFSNYDVPSQHVNSLDTVLPAGTTTTLTKAVAGTTTREVLTISGYANGLASTTLMVARMDSASALATYTATDAVFAPTQGAVFRVYDSLSSAQTVAGRAPMLHWNYKTHWATVTDQRPLRWVTRYSKYDGYVKISKKRNLGLGLAAEQLKTAIVAGGSGYAKFTASTDGTNGVVLTAAATTLTLSGTNRLATTFSWLMLFDGATVTRKNTLGALVEVWPGAGSIITIAGCNANTGLNTNYVVQSVTDTVLTFTANSHGVVGAACAGSQVAIHISSYESVAYNGVGSLIDAKAAVVGDIVKVKLGGVGNYPGAAVPVTGFQSRIVDKVWGSTDNDVTLLNLHDPFSAVESELYGTQAWVDEKGTSEAIECSGRGLCDVATGDCECFSGYWGHACSRQSALNTA